MQNENENCSFNKMHLKILFGKWHPFCLGLTVLTQLHIYASVKWVSIGSGNGLLSVRHQAIAWTNADLLSIEHLGTNFSEIRIKIWHSSSMKMYLKMSSVKWWPFCSGGDGLRVTAIRPETIQHPWELWILIAWKNRGYFYVVYKC